MQNDDTDKNKPLTQSEDALKNNPVKRKDFSLEVLSLMGDEDEYSPKRHTEEYDDELQQMRARDNKYSDFAGDELDSTTLIKSRSEANYLDSVLDDVAPKIAYAPAETKNKTSSGNLLAEICAYKRGHIETQKGIIIESRLYNKLHSTPGPRDFLAAIKAKMASGGNALISEIKKASPSKGVIREDFEPGVLADAYSEGGAACISVLTDIKYFQGRDEYIGMVKKACDIPVLRKDFIIDPYQLVESRALGADCILLIMAALSDKDAAELEDKAFVLGLSVLIEVHDEEEMTRALKLKSPLIGINNRNLKTLAIDLATTKRLAPMVPSDRIIVCESGIYSHDDILTMNQAGAHAFLVGESLMSQGDVKAATEKLLGK